MKVLVLTTVLPRAGRMGGDLGSKFFVDAIRTTGASVTVVGYDRPGETAPPVQWELSAGTRVIESSTDRLQAGKWLLASLATRRAYTQQKYVGREYSRLASGALREKPDIVVIDHGQTAWILREVGSDAPVVYIAHNVESDLYEQQAASAKRWVSRRVFSREQRYMAAAERDLSQRARELWTFGRDDAAALRDRVPDTPVIDFMPVPEPKLGSNRQVLPHTYDVGLLGTWSWGANAAGLDWFVTEVVPHLPDDLTIAVAGVGASWLSGHNRLQYLGVVPDAVRFLDQTAVVALPTVAGSGIQMKALSTISAGAVAVATTKALSGIAAPPSFVHIRDRPEDFAAALVSSQAGARLEVDARRAVGAAWLADASASFREHVARRLNSIAR